MANTLWADEKINSGRQNELDWAKGLAVCFMVLVHVKEELSGIPLTEPYSKIIEFCGSPLAAPVFMMLLGAGIIYSKNRSPQKMALRGLHLLIMNYALNFIAFGIPNLIMFNQTGKVEFWEQGLTYLLSVDILAFAGLTFLFFALAERCRLKIVHILIIVLVLSCANYLLTKPVDDFFLGAILGLFTRVQDHSYFPFLSWIGYPVMGYVFGGLLIRCTDKKYFYKYLSILSILTIVLFSLASVKYNFDIWSIHFGPDEYYYQDFIQYFLVGGIGFFWISLLYFLSEIKVFRPIGHPLSRWSNNVTAIYFAQWIIIGWLKNLKPVDFPADPLINLITGIMIFILSDVVAHLYLAVKKNRIKKSCLPAKPERE